MPNHVKTYKDFLNEEIDDATRSGLSHWIEDYKKTRQTGNIRLAKKLYADIMKEFKTLKLTPEQQAEMWGEEWDDPKHPMHGRYVPKR